MGRKRKSGSFLLSVAMFFSLSLSGCSGPSDAMVAADFSRLYPGCALEKLEGGTDSYDRWRFEPEEVWVKVWADCPGGKTWGMLRYQRGGDGKWQLVIENTMDTHSNT